MNKPIFVSLLVLAAVVLFPPADRVRPATQGRVIGDVSFPGDSELRVNNGFTFISDIGGPVQIRFAQWFVQIFAVTAVGGVFILTAKRKNA